jgi:phosphoglycolate phosphatase
LLRAEAAHLGWAPRFRILVGAGDAAVDKPDPAPFRMALPALGLPAGAVWYVGDTALDMEAAHRAGCAAVLLGNAAHDGGPEAAAPNLAFPDAMALTAYLRGDRRG